MKSKLVWMAAAMIAASTVAIALTVSATAKVARPSAGETIAYIATGPATVGGYNVAHTNAFNAMCKKYSFNCKIVDNVNFPTAAQTMTTVAASGANMVIVNSSGFAAAMLEVAPKFPQVWFVMTSDLETTNNLKNVAGFIQTWREFGYLGGVVAGYMSKTNKAGWVNGLPLAAARKMMGGFIQGARSVNKKMKVLVRYTNSFVDTSLAKQAALTEIADGADVLTGVAGGAQAGVSQAVVEKKKKYIGYILDDYKSAPCCTITSMTLDLLTVYNRIGNLYTSKKLGARLYVGTVKNGSIKLAPLRGVPAPIAKKILAIQARMKQGKIAVADILYP
jgi:basic membrane protein A